MNLQTHWYKTFRRHARLFFEPSIHHMWKMNQYVMFQQLHPQGKISISGDKYKHTTVKYLFQDTFNIHGFHVGKHAHMQRLLGYSEYKQYIKICLQSMLLYVYIYYFLDFLPLLDRQWLFREDRKWNGRERGGGFGEGTHWDHMSEHEPLEHRLRLINIFKDFK